MNATELANLVDHWWATKEKRLAADKVAAALKEEEQRAQATILEEMQKQEITSIGGKLVGVRLKTDTVPVAKDWDAIFQECQRTGDFSILQRRLSAEAVKERWQAGVDVPGVEAFPIYKLAKQGV